jgi:HEAT repeat protein
MSEIEVHINDLVARMTIIEQYRHSDDSISFKATREAETINDTGYVPILKTAIQKEKVRERRDALYFILGKLGKKLSSSDIANYMINQLKSEDNKNTLSFMLDRIAEISKNDDVDIKPLIILADDKRWQVRTSAIKALNKAHDKAAEDKLIEITNSNRDAYDVIYANSVLNQIGTLRAISVLEKHINSRKRDIKISAQEAIKAISKREHLD